MSDLPGIKRPLAESLPHDGKSDNSTPPQCAPKRAKPIRDMGGVLKPHQHGTLIGRGLIANTAGLKLHPSDPTRAEPHREAGRSQNPCSTATLSRLDLIARKAGPEPHPTVTLNEGI